MSLITRFIEKSQTKSLRIDVAGDPMLDEYYDVEATRISPEFPIPVMRSKSDAPSSVKPGGAANVVYQMKHWNTQARLYAWMDLDASIVLKKIMPDSIKGSVDIYHTETPRIPRKRRIYDGKHPAFRWDIEEQYQGACPEVLGNLQKYILSRFSSQPDRPNALILSDYDKGTFATHSSRGISARRDWIKAAKCATIVDPKVGNASSWKGCTIFKPNAKEAKELSGKGDWKSQCEFFLNALSCKHVVITQGGDGVVGLSKMDNEEGTIIPFEYRPNFHIDPKSVIGAGDCFVAFLAMAYSHEFQIEDAVEIAYKAGACYVKHDRNCPVTPNEFLAFEDPITAKFLPPPDTADREFKLGFSNGCFDLFHIGHLESLRFARSQCDKLMVAVNGDASVKRLKGSHRPHIELHDRMNLLAGLECVDYVVSFDEDTPLETIKKYRPDVLIKGNEYKGKPIVGEDIVPLTVLCPMINGTSTSTIEAKIKSSVSAAKAALEVPVVSVPCSPFRATSP